MRYFYSIPNGKESFCRKLHFLSIPSLTPLPSSEKIRMSLIHLPTFNQETWNCTEHSSPGHICAQNTKSLCFWSPFSKLTQQSLLLCPSKSFFSSTFSACNLVSKSVKQISRSRIKVKLEALSLSILALSVIKLISNPRLPQCCVFTLSSRTIRVSRKDINVPIFKVSLARIL